MKKKAAFLLCSCIGIASLVQYKGKGSDVSNAQIELVCESNDAETLISCQKKIPLSTATQADLEMIPGISSFISQRIIESKSELLTLSENMHPDLRFAALSKIKGISLKKAYEIGLYLKVL